MLWAWTAGMVAAILLLLLVPVRLEAVYHRRDREDFLEIEFSLAGGWGRWAVASAPFREWLPEPGSLQLKNLLPGAREEELPGRLPEHTGRDKDDRARSWTAERLARFIVAGPLGYWLRKTRILKDIWQRFLAGVTCQRFRLFLSLGTSEPAATALLYGSIWTLLAWMYQNLRQRSRLNFKIPEWQVVPRFDSPGWQADFNCIFTFRLGHIISAGLRTLYMLAVTVWQVKGAGPVARTSHRGLDEDRHGKHQGYG